ncbi:MAG: hypothetical protein ACFFBD_26825, partial [Candidatus Hodarchaeota archaeon]
MVVLGKTAMLGLSNDIGELLSEGNFLFPRDLTSGISLSGLEMRREKRIHLIIWALYEDRLRFHIFYYSLF